MVCLYLQCLACSICGVCVAIGAGCSPVSQDMTWSWLHMMLFAMTLLFSGESEALCV